MFSGFILKRKSLLELFAATHWPLHPCMMLSKQIKVHSAPADVSKTVNLFLQEVHVSHILYNPQGQVIIKSVDFVLKNQMNKQKWGKGD